MMPTTPTANNEESIDSLVLSFYQAQPPLTETYRIPGSPFEFELREIRDGTVLAEIDKQALARSGQPALMQHQFGKVMSPWEISCYTWLEFGCVGAYRVDVTPEGEQVRKRIGRRVTFNQIVNISKETKDHMIAAGLAVRRLTLGDQEAKKNTDEPETDPSSGSLDTPAS